MQKMLLLPSVYFTSLEFFAFYQKSGENSKHLTSVRSLAVGRVTVGAGRRCCCVRSAGQHQRSTGTEY